MNEKTSKLSPKLLQGLETFERVAEIGLREGRKDVVREELDDLMRQITPVILKLDPEAQEELFARLGAIRVRAREDDGEGGAA